MSEERQLVSARVDKDTYEAAKKRLDHGGVSREIRQTIEAIAHGAVESEKERLKQQLEEERKERSRLRNERAEIDRKLENKDRVIERLENRLDAVRDKEGEYEGALQMIESDYLLEGGHVFLEHKQIQKAAGLGNCDPEDVIADLKERNPAVPNEQFERANQQPTN